MEDISQGKGTRKSILDDKGKGKGIRKRILDDKEHDKGCKYWNLKLQVGPGQYVECVSVGEILDKQGMVKRYERNEQSIEIQKYNRESQGVVFFRKDTMFNTLPSPEYEFKRKVFSLEECDSLHYGHVVDVRAKVICAAEPVTVKMRSGKSLTFQSVLLADESLHMWFDIWETRQRNLKNLSKKGTCHYITKCQTGKLFDVEFIKTTPDTTFKTSDYINQPEISDEELKLIKKSHISQITGKIIACSNELMKSGYKCPSCNNEVGTNDINGTTFTCKKCGTCGLANFLENVVTAEVKMLPVDGGEECTVHLCNLYYPGDNCQLRVSVVNIEELKKKVIAKNLRSNKVWRVRKTPDGNVVNIEEIEAN